MKSRSIYSKLKQGSIIIFATPKKQPLIPEIQAYVDIIRSFQTNNTIVVYPGSPWIVKHFLRKQDDLIVNELHDKDAIQLKQQLKNYPNIHCHQRDAYEFLPALLPPKNKRGLIIIDPPYEKEDEFKYLLNCISNCLQRFSTGIYLIWYPVVSNKHQQWVKQIIANNDFPLLHAYFTRTAIAEEKQRLMGNGVVIINPPWQIDKKIKILTRYLCDLFKLNDSATWQVELKR